MPRKMFFVSLLASSSLALAMTTPAHAGKVDRAHEAIAAADAKINTALSLGAGTALPDRTAEARATLATAREDLSSGQVSPAIEDAIRASALADSAIGEMQRRNDQSVAAAQEAQREGVAAAQDQAATARQQAADANSRAAEANSRAEAAEQSAAMSAADAAAARDAAAAVQQPPAQVETTVTTQQRSGHHYTRTHISRHTTSHATAPSVSTTTSVTQP